MKKVILKHEKMVIPTYEIGAYDKNPMFLEKRVYQGSSGRVYPHPVCESVSDVKTDKAYDAIILENDYIQVVLLPELGGRVQRLLDKTNGYDAVYYNEVVKPALVGLTGPWISGGIEFNWPQHHRPSTYDPVECAITENEDGSVTVWMGETEKMFHTKVTTGFTVYPDRAYLEINARVYNPTDRTQTFLWWANPAVAVNDDTQSIFPPDVHAVMDHGKRAVSEFPISKSVYYKVDYAPGTDISRYKNIPVPTSYMAYHSDFDFIGNYDYGRSAGLLHIADHHVSPGKKQWTWGNGDFGRAWDRNLTDENGPYIELMTGMFTDNQPDFTFLKPYEEKTFTQYFMPYKAVGEIKNATLDAALNVEYANGEAKLTVYAPAALEDVTIELSAGEKVFLSETVTIPTAGVYEKIIAAAEDALTLRLIKDGKELLSHKPSTKEPEPIPSPAEEIPPPEKLETNEELFLAAVHLEQYRHATRSPAVYYLEGLRRDPSDIRLNNGYGKYLYAHCRYAESIPYFKAAVKKSTWKNPNPYDCEPYYNLGLALEMTGDFDGAYDAYYKAVWDGNMQDKAFYHLACLAVKKGEMEMALDFVNRSLAKGAHNMKARLLKTALLRKMGKTEEALHFARETNTIDALETSALYELYLLTGEGLDRFTALMRGDNHNYVELALGYKAAYLYEDAAEVLRLAANDDEPMIHYYLYALTDEAAELAKAEKASSLYCFPNRIEDEAVLRHAAENGGHMAEYYLGCLLYDKGNHQKATALWESAAKHITLPTVWRNLSLAYYNKQHDPAKTKTALENAFEMDKTDARIFFELDQLYKVLAVSPTERLAFMEAHTELLPLRDDLYTEYITLLNLNGKHEKAYDCIMSHNFHPWEGGEGKIPAQYRTALTKLSEMKDDEKEAIELLEEALVYPNNLGEGKLIGNTDSDLYYKLGCLYENKEKKQDAFRLAARGEFDLTSAMYYNDQPPEMMYFAALAIGKLGDEGEMNRRFETFISYAETHMDDVPEIDYFAVSLPDFLIFDADLVKNNKVHCCHMAALGYLGLGDMKNAKKYADMGRALNPAHLGLAALAV